MRLLHRWYFSNFGNE